MSSPRLVRRFLLLACVLALVFTAGSRGQERRHSVHRLVAIPGEDRFLPFALTIRAGDTVEWVNEDTDDHTVVSDDIFNTTGPKVNHLLTGTDKNGGKPGPPFAITFEHPGQFVYYCRFHSHLDADHQPTAPGPDGGIQDAAGNFGTPMSGVITVLARGDHDDQD
jgi:plastocyanin